MSMESQTLAIDEKGEGKALKHRDSESEDLNIPQQKSNLNQNAFFFNMHTFMKENMDNLQTLIIRDLIST